MTKTFVNVHNEWDKLQEIIIGNPLAAKLPEYDQSLKFVERNSSDMFKADHSIFSAEIIEETEEDILGLIDIFKALGITVKRPEPQVSKSAFVTPYFFSDPFYPYCPRDILLTIGNKIIETPCVLQSRYFESFCYKDLLLDYMLKGAEWIAAPKPKLNTLHYQKSENKRSILHHNEPIFDAANVLRAGKDIFFQISDSGNYLGYQWLQTILGENYQVHPCQNIYSSFHLNTTIALLRPGLVLINPERVNHFNLPKPLSHWQVIKAPAMQDYNYSTYRPLSSVWLGMNLLVINENLVIVDEHQTKLIKLLEKHRFEVIPHKLRHGRTLGGGFHSITLDVRRDGTLEDYFC